MPKKIKKLNGEEVTLSMMHRRALGLQRKKYPVSKWIEFCQIMLREGYTVTVKETPSTHSKYVRVHGAGDTSFLVRFSNHKPNYRREAKGDCDFFVGVTHLATTTTQQAIKAVKEFFNAL